MLGPSLTMAIASVSVAVISVINIISSNGSMLSAIPSLLMAFTMLLTATLWPLLTKKNEKKKADEKESTRQKKYLDYLGEVRNRIRRVAREQNDILEENIVSPQECINRVIRKKTNLWERSINDIDFLKLRIGKGEVPLDLNLSFPEKKFSLEDDNLQTEMLKLAKEPNTISDAPISLMIQNNISTGIYGEKAARNNFIKLLILQMISLHSYDELKIIFLCDKSDEEQWVSLKTIPHLWSDDKSTRLFCSCLDEIKEISIFIEGKVLTRSVENTYNNDSAIAPYYVFIDVSETLSKKCEGLHKALESGDNLGFSAIFAADAFSDFPKETTTIINVNGVHSKIYDRASKDGHSIDFDVEKINSKEFDKVCVDISNIRLDIDSAIYSLPSMVDFLGIYNVGKVEHLNSLSRWHDHNPTQSLRAPVGVDADGDIFYLDLHEKYHGPHGLIAGMTGSGKSEFIITYILSMALNYHPYEVSFILIDYKGGGLVDAFYNNQTGVKLPHIAGTITNLDGASVNRSLVSIQSELRRRQALFSKANSLNNEGTMDIYKYQQLYRSGVVSEPCPHLIIVSDEFAELKKQQPEFMDELISTARIGRSLGVHLILATQKPSGVVDDQIWSNSRFRVCLKVQDKSDSQEMIKAPDAAEISETGRFYLQVGYNELFAIGQSAWCGADYIPKDVVEKEKDNSVQIIDNLGRPIISIAPTSSSDNGIKHTKQVVAIVDYLSSLASNEGLSATTLWLPPIPSEIFVDDLDKKYNYVSKQNYFDPVIGELDDPYNQKQDLLKLQISQDGNCIVYGSAGSGKTTLLSTVCYSLIKHHTSDEVNIYILDFGTEALKMFEEAPQVGGFISSSDSSKIAAFFKLIKGEILYRRKLMSSHVGDYTSFVKNSNEKLPGIVVLLNDYSSFSELYEAYIDELISITRECTRYGIYFIVTADSSNSVRYKVQQNFKRAITLQLNDSTDYSFIVGRTNGLVPAPFKGRGLIGYDKVYEFQTAFCIDTANMSENIRIFCRELLKTSTSLARQIPTMPERIKIDSFINSSSDWSFIPVGLSYESIETAGVDLKSNLITPIVSDDLNDMVPFANAFIKLISGSSNTIIIDPQSLLSCSQPGYTTNAEVAVTEMEEENFRRAKTCHEQHYKAEVLSQFEKTTYVLFGLDSIFECISEDAAERLNVALEKADKRFGLRFVIFDSQSKLSSYGIKEWFGKNINRLNGLWIGQGYYGQKFFDISQYIVGYPEEGAYETAVCLSRGKQTLAKVINEEN